MIENEELSGFLKDLLELVKKVIRHYNTGPIASHCQTSSSGRVFMLPDICVHGSCTTLQDYDSSDLADFAKTIMKGCDTNRDGKISKKVSREEVHEGGEADDTIAGADNDPDGAVGAAVIST